MAEQAAQPAAGRPWRVMRQDDNGNQYLVGPYPTRAHAEQAVARLEAGGHKQFYWLEPEPDAPPPSGQ